MKEYKLDSNEYNKNKYIKINLFFLPKSIRSNTCKYMQGTNKLTPPKNLLYYHLIKSHLIDTSLVMFVLQFGVWNGLSQSQPFQHTKPYTSPCQILNSQEFIMNPFFAKFHNELTHYEIRNEFIFCHICSQFFDKNHYEFVIMYIIMNFLMSSVQDLEKYRLGMNSYEFRIVAVHQNLFISSRSMFRLF
eukprot:TRINITY_DN1063_c0_g1_i8.p1 TRINITY_DN1063_c0_g1~~TRINITY_DN1063_c0_g1_i8.p1  ORF type:complete len:189 (-),score=-13.37 TRINITY_DN1063_c0_g1_i8:17-583(-)